MLQTIAYELSPSDGQVVALAEHHENYANLCNRIADIILSLSTDKKLVRLKVAQSAIDRDPSLNAVTERKFIVNPTRYRRLAVNRVFHDLGCDRGKRYTGDDFVDIDTSLATLKVNSLNQPFALTMDIKMFRTRTKVRLPVPCRYSEVTGSDWLPAGKAILVRNKNTWRVVVAVDIPDGDDE